MRRLIQRMPLVGCLVMASGCTLCCAPFDYDYPYVGGRWVRTNPSGGRVGSAFDEAGARVETAGVAPQPAPAQPVPAQPPRAPAASEPSRSVIPRNLGESYLP